MGLCDLCDVREKENRQPRFVGHWSTASRLQLTWYTVPVDCVRGVACATIAITQAEPCAHPGRRVTVRHTPDSTQTPHTPSCSGTNRGRHRIHFRHRSLLSVSALQHEHAHHRLFGHVHTFPRPHCHPRRDPCLRLSGSGDKRAPASSIPVLSASGIIPDHPLLPCVPALAGHQGVPISVLQLLS